MRLKQRVSEPDFQELTQTFKEQWEWANQRGFDGQRVAIGLTAVLAKLGIRIEDKER